MHHGRQKRTTRASVAFKQQATLMIIVPRRENAIFALPKNHQENIYATATIYIHGISLRNTCKTVMDLIEIRPKLRAVSFQKTQNHYINYEPVGALGSPEDPILHSINSTCEGIDFDTVMDNCTFTSVCCEST